MKRLLGLDIDGTIVRRDGSIADADRDAIAQARASGVHVTLVTGRIASGTLPVARELGIDIPVICGDGAQLVDPESGMLIAHASLEARARELALGVFEARELAPFVLTHEAAHGRRASARYAPWVRGFTSELFFHDEWPDVTPLSMLLGLGARELALRAFEELEALAGADVEAFPIGDPWVVRVRSSESTKGRALRDLAAQLGVARENVAFAGDWYNDVSALEWAGRSFAMGQAPPDIKARATDVLETSIDEGGAIAELLARWR